jgi:hypothetical protein
MRAALSPCARLVLGNRRYLIARPVYSVVCAAVDPCRSRSVVTSSPPVHVSHRRLHKIFNAKLSKQKVTLTDRMLLPRVVLPTVAGLAAFVGVWQYVDPLQLTLVVDGSKHTVYYVCQSAEKYYYLQMLVLLEGLYLLRGARISYRVRNLPSDFNESAQIGLCIYMYVNTAACITAALRW